VTATIALLGQATLRLADVVPPELSAQAGAGIGLVLGLVAIALRSAQDRGPKAVIALAMNLRDPDVRDEAVTLIREHLGKARRRAGGRGAEGFARMALIASAPLMAVDLSDVAAQHLSAVDPTRLGPTTLGRWARALAGIQLQLGDADAAREVVARVPRPAREASVERWLGTIDALLASLDGQPERALALVEAVPSPASSDRSTETLALRALRLTAEAHARAARGDEPGARRALDAIRAITPAALDFARQPRGPASDLADQM